MRASDKVRRTSKLVQGTHAQGLPIQFIVIAAIAIIILILIVMFVIGGFRTEAVSSQTAANSCAAMCFAKQRSVATTNMPIGAGNGAVFDRTWDYCTPMDIQGFGTTDCSEISPCTLQYKDDNCVIGCQDLGNDVYGTYCTNKP